MKQIVINKKKNPVLLLSLLSLFIFHFFFTSISVGGPEELTGNTVIIMIGDGMGPEHVEFGRLVEYGPNGTSIINEFPNKNTINTNDIDGRTTDSAASGTAISSGIKTRKGRIGTNYDASFDTTSILDIAKKNGYKTGIVVTCHITHATPAAFAAHNEHRNNYQEIAEDISNKQVDVIFGGGNNDKYFGLQLNKMIDNGYQFIANKTKMNDLSETPVIGLFDGGHLPGEAERSTDLIPSLSEMVDKAIQLLDSGDAPFFLMVEGAQIDWAGHDNDPVYLAHEMVEFEKAVRIAKDFAESRSDVQLIVTADHECGGLKIIDYEFETDLPSSSNTIKENRAIRTSRAGEISVEFSTNGHTKTKVPLVGFGPHTERVREATHLTDIFDMMKISIAGEAGPVDERFYDGYYNILWIYIPAAIAGLVIAGFIAVKLNSVFLRKDILTSRNRS